MLFPCESLHFRIYRIWSTAALAGLWIVFLLFLREGQLRPNRLPPVETAVSGSRAWFYWTGRLCAAPPVNSLQRLAPGGQEGKVSGT